MIAARRAGILVALGTVLLDQLVKWYVTYPLALPFRGQIAVLPIFNLRWVQNYGVSMGFLTADGAIGRWLLVVLTLVITGGVAFWLWREKRPWDGAALGMVLGGACGNIIDRVRVGYVVDYADLHFGDWQPFLVFNLADAAISIGVAILVIRAILSRESAGSSEDVHA
ncbi:signal peptidase II [Sphingomonas naphthae]|uniref:Lipoprotein signal peptidase n=1 Tax=Sphingomonas naphthae TaxID=1813468 RepID=A0ABY7TIL2_9SPHN|nr:signal peptidase II [Sphingomonas naphthae]WCT72567.1 signal peptidase II [Sphingomonas naphthae]